MKAKLGRKQTFSLLGLLLLLMALPLLLQAVQVIRYHFGEAVGTKANIIVEAQTNLGPINQPWQALAQGGEEKTNMVKPVVKEISLLRPQYIRLDHIYDFYEVVQRNPDQTLSFNWERGDEVIDDILATGALPFLSLSYMPPVIAKDGNLTNEPLSWNEWAEVVQTTIEHFSGRNHRNLNQVIYEVWNEPDLFGNWKIGRGKNYCTLYHYASLGASRAQNTNPFKIGGPATTTPYQNWADKFLDYVKDHRLRIDFYSWHRYALEPSKFTEDIDQVDNWLFKNAGYPLEKYLTEWGSVDKNSSYHDANFDAAHLVATARQLLQRVDLAFVFEIKDGPDPAGEKYWGSWGLLTHEQAGVVEKKPKFYALLLLNQIDGERVELEGEGSWVTGLAAKKEEKLKIILTNLDPQGRHTEKVPLTVNQLEEGTYLYKETFLSGSGRRSVEKIDLTGQLKKEIFLSPNNVVLVELTKS